MAHLHRLALALVLGLPLLAVAPVTTAAAAPAVAQVTISDAGFTPTNVTVALGGTVIWQNQGADTHTATTQGQAPLPFDSGGIGPGDHSSLSFQTPGTYYYTSTTDCEGGATKPAFNCGASYSVTVGEARAVATPVPSPVAAPPPSTAPSASAAAPTPAPASSFSAPSPVQQNVTVTITDSGMTPPTVTVGLGGTVSWINQGSDVHSATAKGGVPLFFDTGGLVTGQVASLGFSAPGTYAYTSAPDCIGASTPGFRCGLYTVIVSSASAVSTPPPTPSPAAAPTPPPTGNTSITINDSGGFAPGSLTVKAGQTVTWTNEGNQVHSVVSNPGYIPGFDSGGLGHGQSFSYTFTSSGSFGYHSSTEPVYASDPICQCTVTTYSFNGVVNVQ